MIIYIGFLPRAIVTAHCTKFCKNWFQKKIIAPKHLQSIYKVKERGGICVRYQKLWDDTKLWEPIYSGMNMIFFSQHTWWSMVVQKCWIFIFLKTADFLWAFVKENKEFWKRGRKMTRKALWKHFKISWNSSPVNERWYCPSRSETLMFP